MLVGYPVKNLSVDAFGSLKPVWTVNLEFWLYVFFGFLMLSGNLGKGWVRMLAILIFLASVPPILAGVTNGRGLGLTFVWLAGAIYYRLGVMERFPVRGVYFNAFGLACCLYLLFAKRIMATEHGYDLRYSLTIAGACIFGIECYRALRLGDRGALAIRRFSDFLASYSYSLYLIHYTLLAPILIWLKTQPSHASKYLALVFVILLCNAVAYLFYLAFERQYHAVRIWIKSHGFIGRNLAQSTGSRR